jgi:L-malate glycosyltransferase
MKIAFIYDTVYPETKGGVEKRVWELARRLVRRGHEVHLLVPHAWDGPIRIEREGVTLRGVCRSRDLYTTKGKRAVFPALAHAAGVFRALRKDRFDLVDTQVPALPAALAVRAALGGESPTQQVITWHEAWDESWVDEMGILLGHSGRRVERMVSRLPVSHIAASQFTADQLAKLDRWVDAVVASGVEPPEQNGGTTSDLASDILFVGRLVPTKNLGLLIDATAELTSRGKRPRVLVIGDGPQRIAWEQQAADQGVASLIDFVGTFDDGTQVMAALRSARMLALPSVREGFGIIGLEAAAHGVPVVTVDHERNAARLLVSHGVTGLCVSPTPELFADALQSLLEDEELRDKLSRGAYDSARTATWDRAVDATEAVYRARVTEPPCPAVARPVPGDSRPLRGAAQERARTGIPTSWPDVDGLTLLGYCDHFRLPMIGGSEMAALEVYRAIKKRGANLSVLTSTAGGTSEWSDVDGTPTWTHPMYDLTDTFNLQVGISPGLFRRSLAMVRELEPQVLHASSIHFQTARVAAATARRTGLPLVTTVQVGSIEHLPLIPRLATDGYERSIGSRILAASTKVIAVSDSVAEHVIELGTSPNRVVVVHNGVDTNRFKPTSGRRSNQIVFVGRLISNKRPDDILEAFAQLDRSDWQLVFVGDGPMRRRLERRTMELRLCASVQFLGVRSDIQAVLSKAAIAVRPSLTEGRSLAILEAMASGTCVVASDIVPNRELIEHGVTGLLTPVGDRQRLTEALRHLVDDPNRRSAIGAAGRVEALRSSWDVTASRIAEVLMDAAIAAVPEGNR